MITPGGTINVMVEQALLRLHTAFLGRIVSFNQAAGTATVQPLTKQQAAGKNPISQSVLTDIPVLHNAQYKLGYTETACAAAGGINVKHVALSPIQAGDICLCVTCERDITAARRGGSAVPAAGHHEIKDSVVVGVL